MNVIISACLLGANCRYDGKCGGKVDVQGLEAKYRLIPVCPEIYGGLPIPREPVERDGNRAITKSGADVTAEFMRGAQETLNMARMFDCKMAILKERSPSCGSVQIYDGTFSGRLKIADGVTAELLLQNGIRVYGESQIPQLLADQ